MAKIVWTDSAIDDLNEIGEYIANDSERYAHWPSRDCLIP
ncbi:MAG: toxin ParE1/3/4 [Cryomorphaceae bacterium]|jgi:toxin ParE1/3/4